MNFLLGWPMCRCYVSFRECRYIASEIYPWNSKSTICWMFCFRKDYCIYVYIIYCFSKGLFHQQFQGRLFGVDGRLDFQGYSLSCCLVATNLWSFGMAIDPRRISFCLWLMTFNGFNGPWRCIQLRMATLAILKHNMSQWHTTLVWRCVKIYKNIKQNRHPLLEQISKSILGKLE